MRDMGQNLVIMNATDFRAVAEVFSQMLFPSSSVLTLRLSELQDLDGLHIRRDTLHEEHGRLIKIASAVAEAESSIAATDREITHLAAAEKDDIEHWADQGGHGEPPTLLVHERQKLERTRALAAADLRSAVARREGIQRRISHISSRVPLDIDEAAGRFDAKIAEVMRRHDEAEALRAREHADQCGRALMADDPDASRLIVV